MSPLKGTPACKSRRFNTHGTFPRLACLPVSGATLPVDCLSTLDATQITNLFNYKIYQSVGRSGVGWMWDPLRLGWCSERVTAVTQCRAAGIHRVAADDSSNVLQSRRRNRHVSSQQPNRGCIEWCRGGSRSGKSGEMAAKLLLRNQPWLGEMFSDIYLRPTGSVRLRECRVHARKLNKIVFLCRESRTWLSLKTN